MDWANIRTIPSENQHGAETTLRLTETKNETNKLS